MNEFKLAIWTVSPLTNEINNSSVNIQLRPKQMQLLCLLVAHQGEPVTRERILEELWPGRYGTDEALSRTMSELRKALGPSVEIKTIPKTGYCLVTPINNIEDNPPLESPKQIKQTAKQRPIKVWVGIIVVLIGFIFSIYHYQTKPTVHDEVSVAILPLNNFTDSDKAGLLADGLVEEITHQLAGYANISVASRTSSFYFKDSPIPATEIGEKLSVSHIIEGSIRLTEKGYRITAQLIETKSGFHLWSKTFDSENKGLIKIQEQIAAQVRKLVGQTLLPQSQDITNDLYETYLLGVEAIANFGPDNLQKGEDYFKTVLQEYPEFLPAKIGLAMAIIAQLNWGQIDEERGFLKAEGILNEVEAKGIKSADYYLARALLYSPKAIARKNTSHEKARIWFEKALQESPNDSRILQFYSRYAAKNKAHGIELLKRAVKFDPYNSGIQTELAAYDYWQHPNKIVEIAERIVEQFPDSSDGYFLASSGYFRLKDMPKLYFHSYHCVAKQPQLMDCWANLINSMVASKLYDQALQTMDIALQYAPVLVTEFAILKMAIQGNSTQIVALLENVELSSLNPVLTQTAILWAISQQELADLSIKLQDYFAKATQGNSWHKRLYRYHWLKYKDQTLAYKQDLNNLIEEMQNYLAEYGRGHRWVLAGLALNDQVDQAFELTKTMQASQHLANFFAHYHPSEDDPFLTSMHQDPRWQEWVAVHAATQNTVQEEILAIQETLPLSSLAN
ncbi:winged helix-turn-helix domain-containing protein [Paraglaciecola aestuariivivens]